MRPVDLDQIGFRSRALLPPLALSLRLAYHAPVPRQVQQLRTHHPFFTWWWCDRGAARVQLGGRAFHLAPGSWILLPPNCARDHQIQDGTVLLSISFQATWPPGVPVLEMPGGAIVAEGKKQKERQVGVRLCRAKRRLDEAAPGADGVARQSGGRVVDICRFRAHLHQLVGEIFERAAGHGCRFTTPTTGDGRLDHVLSQMRIELRAGPLPFSDWSRATGLSRSQLDRLSRRLIGTSLRRRRDQMLLEDLQQRLTVGGESIKELAAIFSFVDTAHLCRWVRRQTGRSPVEIRQDLMA